MALATTAFLTNTSETEANDYVLETDTTMFAELGDLFDNSLEKAESMNEESDQFEIFNISIGETEELNDYADDTINVYSSPQVDEELEKWLFRINFESQYAGVNLSDSELMEDSIKAMQKRQVTLLFANDVYGVDFEEEKVRSMIEEEMSTIKEYGHYEDVILTVADNLGLTEDEFLYDFEYDNFFKYVCLA